jgi:hypothetical protein
MPPHPLPRSAVRRQSSANVARRLKAASSTANEKTAYTNAVKRRAKLSGAYLAEYKRALAWAALVTAEWAATGSETARLREGLAEVLSNLA